MIKSFLILSSLFLASFSSFSQNATELPRIDINKTYHGCCSPVKLLQAPASSSVDIRQQTESQESLDITDPEMVSFSASPNPTKGFLSISVPPSLLGSTIQVMDMTGRFVGNPIPIRASVENITLDGNPGIYLISVRTENQVITERVLMDK